MTKMLKQFVAIAFSDGVMKSKLNHHLAKPDCDEHM